MTYDATYNLTLFQYTVLLSFFWICFIYCLFRYELIVETTYVNQKTKKHTKKKKTKTSTSNSQSQLKTHGLRNKIHQYCILQIVNLISCDTRANETNKKKKYKIKTKTKNERTKERKGVISLCCESKEFYLFFLLRKNLCVFCVFIHFSRSSCVCVCVWEKLNNWNLDIFQ